ncbi:MAG: hypothetical protein RIR00_316, partial [Pseudomonadota bacterium]
MKVWTGFWRLVALCLLLAAVPLRAQDKPAERSEGNMLEAMQVMQQGTDLLVKLEFRKELAAPPAGFSIATPARIALDFAGTGNALGQTSKVFNVGELTSANIVQAGERTRLVLNLSKSLNYSTRQEGRVLYVVLSPLAPVGGSANTAAATRFKEASGPATAHAISDINFRRGKDGEGRIVVDLSDSGVGVDIRQVGTNLVVDFLNTNLPEKFRRKLDVLDFATPVSHFVTAQQGGNIRMTITPNGLWEHNAYQTDNQFIVEVKRMAEDPNRLVQSSKIGYQGPRVSINYQNGDVRALLRLMAEELGLNAVISETVSGSTTLVLKDVPADQVIDIIFQQKGLDMRKNGNVILIAPRDEIATREKLEFESRQQISDVEPLITETFRLNYQKALDMMTLIRGQTNAGQGASSAGSAGAPGSGATGTAGASSGTSFLSKRGSVTADNRTNTLFVNDTPSRIEELRKLIKVIDVPLRQVMIEARLVQADDTFSKNLGARLGFRDSSGTQGRGLVNNSSGRISFDTSSSGGGSGYKSTGVNLPSFTDSGGVLSFTLFNRSRTAFLDVELAALETDGRGKIVSSPRVVTADKNKATIKQGTSIPYQTVSTTGTQTTFFEAVLSLEVTPQITPEGTVLLDLLVKKDAASTTVATTAGVAIETRQIKTQVVVENGGTVVIGGIYELEDRANT